MQAKARAKARTGHLTKRTSNLLISSGLMAAIALGLLPATGSHAGNSSAGLFAPPIAEAQNFGQRTIQGKVLDDTDTPVAGATVFLKNVKSRDIKSFSSVADGSFRFAQVGMVDDYEVWAEQGKKKSGVKTISSFDSRKLVAFDLKLK
jgi:hypothetical protein